MAKQKILITGAGGLIGSAFTRKLSLKSDKYEMFALTSGANKGSFPSNVHHITADLLKYGECERVIKEVLPDIVVHFAWSLSKHDFMNSPQNLAWLSASLGLLNSFLSCCGKHFVFAGSSAEYGTKLEVCHEKIEPKPENLYGDTKKAFQQIAKRACELQNKQFTELCFFPVYGEGDIREKSAIPEAIRSFLANESFLCKSPENTWDFIYKDDAAEAAIAVIESGFCGSVNIASGKPIKMREVFTEVANAMESEKLLSFGDNKTALKLVADTSLLNNQIGFSCKTPFNEGIKRTVEWWKKRENTDERL